MITSTDYYIGKEVKADQESRNRQAQVVHYLVAAVLCANEEGVTAEQMASLIYEINSYTPKKKTTKEATRNLGF